MESCKQSHFIDSHAHLTGEDVFPFAEQMIERALLSGISKVLNICTDLAALERGVVLKEKFPDTLYNVAAITPHNVDEKGELEFDKIATYARKGQLVALGETGLDYYNSTSDWNNQANYFRKYLQLALECRLPIVIHCRNAFEDFFKIIDEGYLVDGKHGPGVVHCFTGTLDEAKAVIERGWYISLSGIVTFKKSEKLREIAKWLPLERLLIETDTPYLAPLSKRGKVNEPAFVIETAQIIADVKGIALEELAVTTADNTLKLFSKI
ncbi:MAG: yabD [Chlamydiales bacterium]|jgi:TatD DNase family protein|nr:yabD [Chlamydiales bacterium]